MDYERNINETDVKVLKGCAKALKHIGLDDDLERMKDYINGLPDEDKFEAACQVAVSHVRGLSGAISQLSSLRELYEAVTTGRLANAKRSGSPAPMTLKEKQYHAGMKLSTPRNEPDSE